MIYILLDTDRKILHLSYSKGRMIAWIEEHGYKITYIEETDWDKVYLIRGAVVETGAPATFYLEVHNLE